MKATTTTDDGGEKLFNASVAGGWLSAVRLAAGFLKNKYVALSLGASGVGVLAQGTQLSLLLLSLGSMAVAVGVIHQLASCGARGDADRRDRVLSTAFTLQLVLSGMVALLAGLSCVPLSRALFGDYGRPSWVVAIAVGVPLATMAGSYLEAVLFGHDRFDLYVRASIVATILGLVAYVALVRVFGLSGGFWGISAGSVLLFACFAVAASRLVPAGSLYRFGFDREIARSLVGVSGTMLGSAIANYGSALILRRLALDRFGDEAAGILQVPIALSAYSAPFLTNALWGRLHPFVASHGEGPESRRELVRSLEWNALLSGLFAVGCLAFADFLIWAAYSERFTSAVSLLPLQVGGDVLFFIWFTTSVFLLGGGYLRTYLAGWLVYYALVIGCAWALLDWLGLQAFPAAHAVASTAAAVASLSWLARGGMRVWRAAGLATLSLVAVGLQWIVRQSGAPLPAKSLIPALLGAAFWLLVRPKPITESPAKPL